MFEPVKAGYLPSRQDIELAKDVSHGLHDMCRDVGRTIASSPNETMRIYVLSFEGKHRSLGGAVVVAFGCNSFIVTDRSCVRLTPWRESALLAVQWDLAVGR